MGDWHAKNNYILARGYGQSQSQILWKQDISGAQGCLVEKTTHQVCLGNSQVGSEEVTKENQIHLCF